MSDPIDDAKAEVSQALKSRAGEPSADAADAERQVGELRDAITRDLDELRGRLPEGSEISGKARSIGGAVAAGVAALGALVVVLRSRSQRRKDEERVRVQAIALARELSRLELAPEDVVEDGGSPWVKIVAVLAAVGGVAAGALAVRQRLRGDDADWQE